jgi:hypothetical protein
MTGLVFMFAPDDYLDCTFATPGFVYCAGVLITRCRSWCPKYELTRKKSRMRTVTLSNILAIVDSVLLWVM